MEKLTPAELRKIVDEEEWRPVFGYEGLYEVSNYGAVRGNRGLLNPLLGRTGYCRVGLYKDKKQKSFFIHALVLTAFVGNKPEGFITRHLDGVRTNNRLDNLRWGTYKENEIDKRNHGTTACGEKIVAGKLTREQAIDILMNTKSHSKTNGVKIMARKHNVDRAAVTHIMMGRSWKCLDDIRLSMKEARAALQPDLMGEKDGM